MMMEKGTRIVSDPIRLADEPDFDVGHLRARPSRGEVEHEGAAERLEPRLMQVLVVLAQASGETVSREALIAQCWGGVVVGPDAVSRTISLLRRVFGAKAGARIETLPRIGYRLIQDRRNASEATAIASSDWSALSDPTSGPSLVAVLPFAGEGAPDAERLADGVSDTILSALSRGDAPVVARHSAFQFRGERKRHAADALGASHIIDGSLVVDRDMVRVTTHLIDVSRDIMLWSEGFAAQKGELSALEDKIAERLAVMFGIRPARHTRVADAGSVVRDLYRRAMLGLEQPSREPIEQALAYLNEVVARASDFAPGWAALAEAQRLLMLYLPPPAQGPACSESRRSAERALALDAGLGQAYGTLASLLPRFGNWSDVERLFEKGLAVDPASPSLLHLYAQFLLSVGRTADGLERLAALQKRNPLNAALAVDLAAALLDVGRLEEALAAISRAYALWPQIMLVWSECVRLHVVTDAFDRTEALLNNPPASVGPGDLNIARRKLHLMARRYRRSADMAAAVKNFQDFSQIGIAPATVAVHALCSLDQPEAGLAVANEIFVSDAPQSRRPGVNMMGTFTLAGEPDSTVLFRYENADMRFLPGFKTVVDRIGLGNYWRQSNATPHFLATDRGRAAQVFGE